jgi:hypothetical protein
MDYESVKYYYDTFIDTSSDESDGDTDILMAAATFIHEHNESQLPRHRGSVPGRAPNLERNREAGHVQLYNDYFHPTEAVFKAQFRRRFRMSRKVFMNIIEGVRLHDPYFQCKPDATGKIGFTSYQKCSAAIRMLAYGVAGDLVDEYMRMGESTCLDSMYKFCRAVIDVFGEHYLREPNMEDTARLLSINEKRGFPGMLGSIDCMHWEWKNCPFAWQGQYKGHSEGCTVILEAIASHDLWIWHSFFGMAGSHNDLNVLQRSPVFARLAEGNAPSVNYEIMGHSYTKGYYLADGIYPEWSTFVKTIRDPRHPKNSRFAKEQEAARKDVERAFGVLQSRFAAVRYPAKTWSQERMWEVMTCCVIMHNMIVEDERDDSIYDQGWQFQGELVAPIPGPASFQDFLHCHHEIRDREVHQQLQKDLVDHMWLHVGNMPEADEEDN